MLADDLDRSARELGRKMAEQTAQLAAAREGGEDDEGDVYAAVPTTSQRTLTGKLPISSASGSAVSVAAGGRIIGSKVGAQTDAGSAAKRRKSEQPSRAAGVQQDASTSSIAGSKKTIELTEECVRQYLMSMGGKAPISGIKEVRSRCFGVHVITWVSL